MQSSVYIKICTLHSYSEGCMLYIFSICKLIILNNNKLIMWHGMNNIKTYQDF